MVAPAVVEIQRAQWALIRAAGDYLRNPVREPGLCCRVCAAPDDGLELCRPCRRHRSIGGTAKVVVPLTYAIGGTESAALVHDYKSHPLRGVRHRHGVIINSLVRLALTLHEDCLASLVGMPVSARVVVPSLISRPDEHPLSRIAREMNALGEAVLVPRLDAVGRRAVRPDKFELRPPRAVAGRHVLVLDDVWTTGSNAQSAALTLRHAGAAAVSIMVVGRWLNPRHGATEAFIANRLAPVFDPSVCPVTGGACP